MSSRNYIWLDKRIVGEVKAGVFLKDRWHSKSFMLRKPMLAIAFDRSTLIDAQMLKADRAKITDFDSGLVFRASFAEILGSGFPVQLDWGNQVALMLKGWDIRDAQGNRVSLEDAQKRLAVVLNIRTPKAQPPQLALL